LLRFRLNTNTHDLRIGNNRVKFTIAPKYIGVSATCWGLEKHLHRHPKGIQFTLHQGVQVCISKVSGVSLELGVLAPADLYIERVTKTPRLN